MKRGIISKLEALEQQRTARGFLLVYQDGHTTHCGCLGAVYNEILDSEQNGLTSVEVINGSDKLESVFSQLLESPKEYLE